MNEDQITQQDLQELLARIGGQNPLEDASSIPSTPFTPSELEAPSSPSEDAPAVVNTPLVAPPDYSRFRVSRRTDWRSILPASPTLLEATTYVFERTVFLPNPSLFGPIAISYFLIPSAMANTCPLLIFHGVKGSGKSQGGQVAALIHGKLDEIKGSASTFAALRNALDSSRWLDSEKRMEVNSILIIDDIKESFFSSSPDRYNMVRSGTYRDTDRITLASKDKTGENLEFRCFGPKILSTVEQFWSQQKYSELLRRIIVIPCKPWELFTPDEKRESLEHLGVESLDVRQKMNLRGINWVGFENLFRDFWENESNCYTYANWVQELVDGSVSIPDIISGEKWDMSIDLLATGLTVGVWESAQQAVDHMARYWTWFNESIERGFSNTHRVLREFMSHQLEQAHAVNEKVGSVIMPLAADCSKVREYILTCNKSGMLDRGISNPEIAAIMADIGYRQEGQNWVPMID
ncbi:MAG TPA: hypothetical protein V6C65_08570 [Allocoleopsis sp.]